MERKTEKGWLEIGGKRLYYKSRWEKLYAIWLQVQKDKGWIKDWDYEPKTFWFTGIKRGCVSYKPDFLIIDNDSKQRWVEVKGYMDSKSATKLKRFKKYFPEETMSVVGKEWFSKNSSKIQIAT